jgi:hypothetical protein
MSVTRNIFGCNKEITGAAVHFGPLYGQFFYDRQRMIDNHRYNEKHCLAATSVKKI